jgi:SAM-dependent methyltransferase
MIQSFVKDVAVNLKAGLVEGSSDPFEKAFEDYMSGMHNASLIVRTNKGEDELMPVRYFFRTFDEMPEIEKIALDQCSGKILDIGAGTGCHSIVLQDKGFDVTAIDIRPALADIMLHRGIKKVFASDVFDLKKGSYNTLLLLMNGIGFTGNLPELQKFLSHARSLMATGGQILLDSCDLIYLHEEVEGACRVNLNEGYHGEIVYEVEYKGLKGQPFNWLFVDFTTLTEIASAEGFQTDLLSEGEQFSYLARLC